MIDGMWEQYTIYEVLIFWKAFREVFNDKCYQNIFAKRQTQSTQVVVKAECGKNKRDDLLSQNHKPTTIFETQNYSFFSFFFIKQGKSCWHKGNFRDSS